MTIYELTNDYLRLLMMAESEELDAEAIKDTLEGLDGEIEIKAEGYAKVMKQLQADVDALKTEEDRLSNRRKAIDNNIKRMKEVLQSAMEATGKEKFKTELFSFGIQNNPPSVEITDESLIPDKYLVLQAPKIDKKALLDDVKAGAVIEGVSLVQGKSLRIR